MPDIDFVLEKQLQELWIRQPGYLLLSAADFQTAKQP